MAVLVTMQVGPVDPARFAAAIKEFDSRTYPGFRSRKVYTAEGDPKTVLLLEEWDSHDAFHKATEGEGDEFNAKAGTEGLDWITGIWTIP